MNPTLLHSVLVQSLGILFRGKSVLIAGSVNDAPFLCVRVFPDEYVLVVVVLLEQHSHVIPLFHFFFAERSGISRVPPLLAASRLIALARPVSADEWKTLRMLYRFHGEVHIKLGPV
jgi:hypothetical protein